jgi:hypothetical protein
LDFPEGVRFLTCKYCSSKLEVVETETTLHTKLLEKMVERGRVLEGQLRVMQIQSDIDKLDRNWQILKESYTSYGRYGRASLPSVADIAMQMMGMFVAAILLLLSLDRWDNIPFFLIYLFGLLMMVLLLFSQLKKLLSYERDMGKYEARRSQLLRDLESRRKEYEISARKLTE